MCSDSAEVLIERIAFKNNTNYSVTLHQLAATAKTVQSLRVFSGAAPSVFPPDLVFFFWCFAFLF